MCHLLLSYNSKKCTRIHLCFFWSIDMLRLVYRWMVYMAWLIRIMSWKWLGKNKLWRNWNSYPCRPWKTRTDVYHVPAKIRTRELHSFIRLGYHCLKWWERLFIFAFPAVSDGCHKPLGTADAINGNRTGCGYVSFRVTAPPSEHRMRAQSLVLLWLLLSLLSLLQFLYFSYPRGTDPFPHARDVATKQVRHSASSAE